MLEVKIVHPNGEVQIVHPTEEKIYADLFSQIVQGSILSGRLILIGGDLECELPGDGSLTLGLVLPLPVPDYWAGNVEYCNRAIRNAIFFIKNDSLWTSVRKGGYQTYHCDQYDNVDWEAFVAWSGAKQFVQKGAVIVGTLMSESEWNNLSSWARENKIPLIQVEEPYGVVKATVDEWADKLDAAVAAL